MAPSPPSRVPTKRRPFAEMQNAAPQIAPERMRKAIGKGLVRFGTKDNLSAISSPRPNAEITKTAIVEPSSARRESRRSSQWRCAAQLTAAEGAQHREPTPDRKQETPKNK